MHINDHPFGSYSLPSDAADHPHVHPRATRLPQDARRQISSAGGQETWEAFHLIMASGHESGIIIQRSLVLTMRQQIGCKFDQRPLALKNTNLMHFSLRLIRGSTLGWFPKDNSALTVPAQ